MVDISNPDWSVTDGSNTQAPPNGWPVGMASNQVRPTAQAMMGGIKRLWERSGPALSTTGSAGAYVYTPTNTSYPTALVDGDIYAAIANFTSVGSDTLNINSLGALKLYKPSSAGPVVLGAGDLVSGEAFVCAYDSTLNSSAGGFHVLAGLLSNSQSQIQPPMNSTMYVSAASTSGTYTASAVSVAATLTSGATGLGNYSKTINLATTGAGGMDTGSAPISGYVAIYAIYNPSTGTSSILACSETTSSGPIYSGANLPSGYTQSGLLGIWPTNSLRQFPAGYCLNKRFYYGSSVTLSTISSNSYTSVSLATAVPVAAILAHGFLVPDPSANKGLSISLASTSAGLLQQIYSQAYEATSTVAETTFSDLPIITAQTIYAALNGASVPPARVSILGYSF